MSSYKVSFGAACVPGVFRNALQKVSMTDKENFEAWVNDREAGSIKITPHICFLYLRGNQRHITAVSVEGSLTAQIDSAAYEQLLNRHNLYNKDVVIFSTTLAHGVFPVSISRVVENTEFEVMIVVNKTCVIHYID